MPKLTVERFSAIQSADIRIAPLTILVGPQASGKSLLSKLLYFFNDILPQQIPFAQEGDTLRVVREKIASSFKDWFPPATWGDEQFSIHYKAGPLGYGITRKKSARSNDVADVEVVLSKFFSDHYTSLFRRLQHAQRQVDRPDEDTFSLRFSDPRWEIQRSFYKSVSEKLEQEFLQTQIFIPAGRAFFTNLGKAFAILEYGGRAEPITSRFGSLYANLLDEGVNLGPPMNRSLRNFEKAQQDKRRSAMVRLFDGHLRLSGNKQFLETKDGRRIPLAYMSSGQQELLPLWLTLGHFSSITRVTGRDREGYSLLFIEEPEAHLFPSTQSFLVEYLAGLISESGLERRLIVSTHSPYVLAKINNLLKAGQLGELNTDLGSQVSRIVSRASWLPPGSVCAYAIRDGEVEDIMDEDDGLLSGSYLDEISNDISSEFMSLLNLETKYEP